jgi:hypothetical protein
MKALLLVLGAGLIIASCQAPVEKQYFSESADIDLGRKVMAAYLAADWDAYPEFYADTARIWRNKNWKKDDGFTSKQYVEDLKKALESVSSYKFEPQVWHSIIIKDGEHWVLFWGIWTGHNDATNKDYDIPVNLVMQIVDNKIVQQLEFYNAAEITIDMMELAKKAEVEDEVNDQ